MMMMIMIFMHIACFIRLSDGEVEVLPNAVKSYGAISEKVSTRMIKICVKIKFSSKFLPTNCHLSLLLNQRQEWR